MAQVSTYALTAALSGLATRQQIGLILLAIQSANSASTAPSSPVEGMVWRDTSNASQPVFKVYRLGAWVSLLADIGITATAAQINAGIFYTSATAPSSPVEGSRWRDTSTPANPVDKVYRLGAWVLELVDLGLSAPQNTFIGRKSAGTGVPEVMTPAEARVAMGVDPAGGVQFFAMSTAPAGWLKANGALVSRTAYAALFAAIGTTYGTGDGSTTFALPDLRGAFLRAWDDGRGIDAGRAFGNNWQWDDIRAHNHTIIGHVSQTAMAGAGGGGWGAGVGWPYTAASSTVIQNTGGTETRPPNMALLACIKF